MPKYQVGEIVCSTLPAASGGYHASVLVKANLFQGRSEHRYESLEVYADKVDAMREAISYVQLHFPPE